MERLAVAAADCDRLVNDLAEARARRAFLIMACHRRGISLRVIAKAAGLHYTRIQQMVRVADDVNKSTDITTPRARKQRPKT